MRELLWKFNDFGYPILLMLTSHPASHVVVRGDGAKVLGDLRDEGGQHAHGQVAAEPRGRDFLGWIGFNRLTWL